MAAIIVRQKGNVVLGFPAISVYSMAIPSCDEARAACDWCAQLNSYPESETRSPSPVQLSIVCNHAASDGKLGGSLRIRLVIHY